MRFDKFFPPLHRKGGGNILFEFRLCRLVSGILPPLLGEGWGGEFVLFEAQALEIGFETLPPLLGEAWGGETIHGKIKI